MHTDFAPIQYKYSKFWSIFYAALLSLLVVMPILEISEVREIDEFSIWYTVIYELILFPPLIYIIIKGLIPALTGKVALEINSTGIVSYMLKKTIEWDNIEYIDVSLPNNLYLMITYKWEINNGKSIKIPLRLVKGKAYDIYGEAMYYLKHPKN